MKKLSKTNIKKLEKECIEAIKNNNLTFIDEIFIFIDVEPSQFYEAKLDETQVIKDAIEINRAKLKHDLRIKWFESTNATLNAALYKLICTEDEKRSLSSTGSSKQVQNNDLCTQEEYLKSLKEMGEGLEVSSSETKEII